MWFWIEFNSVWIRIKGYGDSLYNFSFDFGVLFVPVCKKNCGSTEKNNLEWKWNEKKEREKPNNHFQFVSDAMVFCELQLAFNWTDRDNVSNEKCKATTTTSVGWIFAFILRMLDVRSVCLDAFLWKNCDRTISMKFKCNKCTKIKTKDWSLTQCKRAIDSR